MKRLRFGVVFPLLALCAISGLASGAAERPPNIVFILADDLGWGDVGFNGERFYETPAIDALAASGMVFDAAYTGGPNCAPMRACFMTGTYTPRHKIYQPSGASKGDPRQMRLRVPVQPGWMEDMPDAFRNAPPAFESRTELAPSFVSLAEMLKDAGYTTARFGKWHLGPDTQGFNVSSPDGVLEQHEHRRTFYRDPEVAGRLTDAGVKFIDEHKSEPFFLYVSHYDVHTPLIALDEVVEKYEKKHAIMRNTDPWTLPVYAAMVEAVDLSVGRIVDAIDAAGLGEDTLIIFSSDNGGFEGATDNAPLRAGKGALYEGGVRVATCMRWMGRIEAGTRCDTPITSVDWMPTYAALSGGVLPTTQPVDGVSIVPLMEGGTIPERAIFWHHPLYLEGEDQTNYIPYVHGTAGQGPGFRASPAGAMRRGEWKLIEYFDDGRLELYRVGEDISESREVSTEEPEVTARLHEELRAWRNEVDAVVPTERNAFYEGE